MKYAGSPKKVLCHFYHLSNSVLNTDSNDVSLNALQPTVPLESSQLPWKSNMSADVIYLDSENEALSGDNDGNNVFTRRYQHLFRKCEDKHDKVV